MHAMRFIIKIESCLILSSERSVRRCIAWLVLVARFRRKRYIGCCDDNISVCESMFCQAARETLERILVKRFTDIYSMAMIVWLILLN